MSSRPGTNHLDATAGREVVFCHACNHEWYKDEQPNGSLVCPRCHGEATEIVSPENDPRSIDDGDSDPDEADIDDFRYPPPAPQSGAGGFFGRRSVHRGSDRFPPAPFGGSGNNRRTNPGDGADIIRSFQELLGDIGGPGGRPGLQQHLQPYGSPRRVTYQSFSGPNFTGGISSITITGPGSRVNPREPGALAGGDAEFQRVFGDIFRGPPIDHDEHGHDNQNQTRSESDGFPPGGTPGQDRPLDLATALNQLFANLLNPHGTYGDGVYTQEALDRIITNLMEANPQSNAAVPASTQAIESLVRKPLDKEILGTEPKGECTICIDDMLLGDVATFLPCKHWFHEECVVLWLKEHNTCPICRAVIDGGSAQAQGSAAGPSSFPASSSSPAQPQMTSFWSTSAAPAPPPDWTRPTPGETSAAERRRANFREHGAARLDALRDVGQRDREQEQLDRSPAPRGENSTTNNNYNSNYNNNNNNNNSGNSGGSNGGSSSGSGGPFSWFRDQFRDRRP